MARNPTRGLLPHGKPRERGNLPAQRPAVEHQIAGDRKRWHQEHEIREEPVPDGPLRVLGRGLDEPHHAAHDAESAQGEHRKVPDRTHPARNSREQRPGRRSLGLKARRLLRRRAPAPPARHVAECGHERVTQLADRGIARRGIKLGRADDDGAQRLGHARSRKAALAVTRRGLEPRHAEEEQHAERVDVAPHVRLPKAELLGRRIGARAKVRGVPLAILSERSGNPQVDEGDPGA